MQKEETRCTREEALRVVDDWSEQTKTSRDLVMYVNERGLWEINPAYKWIPFPIGKHIKTYVARWLALHVGRCKYLVAKDESKLAINPEFYSETLFDDTVLEIFFCLIHASLAILPKCYRQQVFDLRKIRQSGYALNLDVAYSYRSVDFLYAKSWLLGDAMIPEAIEEIGINPSIVFQAIESNLINWRAAFCTNEDERTSRLDKVHKNMQPLIDDNEFENLPYMDVFGDYDRAWEKMDADRKKIETKIALNGAHDQSPETCEAGWRIERCERGLIYEGFKHHAESVEIVFSILEDRLFSALIKRKCQNTNQKPFQRSKKTMRSTNRKELNKQLLNDTIERMPSDKRRLDSQDGGELKFERSPSFDVGPELKVSNLCPSYTDLSWIDCRIECGWRDVPIYVVVARIPSDPKHILWSKAVDEVVDALFAEREKRIKEQSKGVYTQEANAKCEYIAFVDIDRDEDPRIWFPTVWLGDGEFIPQRVEFSEPPQEENDPCAMIKRLQNVMRRANLCEGFYGMCRLKIEAPKHDSDLLVKVTFQNPPGYRSNQDDLLIKVRQSEFEEIKAFQDAEDELSDEDLTDLLFPE